MLNHLFKLRLSDLQGLFPVCSLVTGSRLGVVTAIVSLSLSSEVFTASPAEFFGWYCVSCHEDRTEEAGHSFEKVAAFGHATLDTWAAVRDQLQLRLMPPAEELQPTDEERRVFAAWIALSLRSAEHLTEETELSIAYPGQQQVPQTTTATSSSSKRMPSKRTK